MVKALPLLPHYFQSPALSEREEQYLVGKAKESAKALVDATRNNEGPVRWEEAGMHRGVQMYKGEARYPESVVGESIAYGCGATTIQATLDEVADFFDLSTEAKVADFVESFPDVLDAQLLYVLEDPALLNDTRYNARSHRSGGSKMLNANQVTVSWLAMDLPSKLLRNRDFLTVECQSTFLDVSGRRGWVRAFHSIKLPCCPELTEYNLVRGSFYHSGYVFVESERPGCLDVIFSAQVHMKGSIKVPTPLYATIQKKRLASIAQLQNQLTRRRLGAQRFLGDLELVPKSQRTQCHLCLSKFGLLTRKARCRKCGEVVCASACSTEWDLAIATHGVRKVRVCAKCAQHTDPAGLDDHLTRSDDDSETHSGHDDDDDAPDVHARAPGYQYDRYIRSDSEASPTSHRGPLGRDSDEYDGQGVGHGRRGHDERYRPPGDLGHDSDVEYPRTMALPGSEDSDPEWYHVEGPDPDAGSLRSAHRRDVDEDAEPRRALQRQQRAMQQHPTRHRLRQRQPRAHDELRRRRQQHPGVEPEREAMASLTSTQSSDASVGAPSFLTSSLLALHTQRMGTPGLMPRPDPTIRPPARTTRKEPEARTSERRRPAPLMPSDRPLTRLEQMQVTLWEEQEARFRARAAMDPSGEPGFEATDLGTLSPRRRRTGSSDGPLRRRGPKLPAFFRSAGTVAHESPSAKPPRFPTDQGTNTAQTVSAAEDEDCLDAAGLRSNAPRDRFLPYGSLLRPEDLRPTEESVQFTCDSMGQDDETDDDEALLLATATAMPAELLSESAFVELYARILDLTGKQRELKAQPEADASEQDEVARELDTLYHQLHAADSGHEVMPVPTR